MLRSVFIIILFTAAFAAKAQETFTPIAFERGDPVFSVSADPRFGVGHTGSVEIGVQLDATREWPQSIVLVANESKSERRFSIEITKDGRSIGIRDDRGFSGLPYDFTETGFYQIGAATRGPRTEFYINGEDIGHVDRGYGDATDLPVAIGSGIDGDGMVPGAVAYLRFWKRALDGDDFDKTFAYFADVEELPQLQRQLGAYSFFTDIQQTMFFPKSGARNFATAGGGGGATPGGERLTDLFEKDARVSAVTVWSGPWVRAIQFELTHDDGAVSLETLHGEPDSEEQSGCLENCAFRTATTVQVFVMSEEVEITGFTATAGAFIDNIEFFTSSGGSSGKLGAATDGPRRFGGEIPKGAKLRGVRTRSGQVLKSLSLLYAFDLPFDDLSGRWVDIDAKPPSLKTDAVVANQGGTSPHGNYSKREVLTLKVLAGGHSIDVRGDGYSLERLFRQSERVYESPSFTLEFGRTGEFTLQRKAFTQNVTVIDIDFPTGPVRRYQRAKPYEKVGQNNSDFTDYGGTFNLDNQIRFAEYAFHGYDVTLMDPQNLQLTRGQGKPVFRKPRPDSRDFYVYLGKNVPYGFYHFENFVQSKTSQSYTLKSSSDVSEAHSNSIGVSLGVPKIGNFSYSEKLTRETQTHQAKQESVHLTRDSTIERAIVVDDAHIELSDEFRIRVLELADKRAEGGAIDWVAEFIRPFGTHYAHAITTGSVGFKKITYSSKAYGELHKRGRTIGAHADGVIKKVKVGVDYSQSDDYSDAFNNEMSRQFEEEFRIGRENEPSPVFYDLRLLSDMLSSVHFDDAAIYQNLREEARAAINAYVAARAPLFDRPEDIWEPYAFEVGLGQMYVNDDGEQGNTAELYGKLELTKLDAEGLSDKQVWSRQESNYQEIKEKSFSGKGTTGSQIHFLTATEICDGSVSLLAGGHLKEDNGVRDPDDLGQRYKGLSPRTATSTAQYTTLTFKAGSSDRHPDTKVTVKAYIKRLPNISGQYKAMPNCARLGGSAR